LGDREERKIKETVFHIGDKKDRIMMYCSDIEEE